MESCWELSFFNTKLSLHLKEWGFEINPYSHYTFDKTINGEQPTVQFHVNDLKVSHKDPQVLENLMKKFRGVFGKEDKLMETKGKLHNYLGLTINH